MTDGLLKSAPQETQIKVEIPADVNLPMMIDGVSVDLMRYFNIDSNNMDINIKNKLTEIQTHLKDRSMGDIMQTLKSIELRTGVRDWNQRVSTIWNYLKISKQIIELNKQRDSLCLG